MKIKGLPSLKVSSIPEGDIKLVRILKTASLLTVQFVVKRVEQITSSSIRAVGIDLGIKSLAVLSDSNEVADRECNHSTINELHGDLHLQTRAGK